MNEQLLALKEISNLVIARSREEGYDTENLLSKSDLDGIQVAERNIRQGARQLSHRADPRCKPYVLDSIRYLLRMCVQVNSCRTAQLEDMPSGVALPVIQAQYEFELRLTCLFGWLVKTFSRFISDSQPLPPLFLEDNLGSISRIRDLARSKFRKSRIDKELVEIAVKPFTIFLSRRYKLVYHDFKYLCYFRKAFLKFLGAKKFTNESVCTFLHEQNTNTLLFLHWQVAQIRSLGMKCKTARKRIVHYHNSLRTIRQLPRKTAHFFEQGSGSVALIENWILAEIEYLEKELLYDPGPSSHEQPETSALLKLETSLSVAELSCLFNLFYDCSVVKPESKAGLMRFVSNNFKTPRTASISDRSLLRKTIGIERATIASVKKTLVKMMNKLREEG